MNSNTAERLLALNREFYERFGDSFSATRQKLQPGVRRILELIQNDESVLDLGCGNGFFLHELHGRGHQAALLGVDFSLPLLREAERTPGVDFWEIDLSQLSSENYQWQVESGKWAVVTMFATLHHIPSEEIRLDILRTMKRLLKPGGKFYLSNWQFLNSEKLKARIQPWSRAGLSDDDVDAGDYLLDWRSGGEGLRYAHQFSEEELLRLAEHVQMKVEASFLSDGENGRLGLYQIWGSIRVND
ncbi:MAG: class I SAM-dependent methyltransferase [Anaerolineales bacterium]|nr:class I SAM-dependent methyltransferase [Anaerolineales bacterium]